MPSSINSQRGEIVANEQVFRIEIPIEVIDLFSPGLKKAEKEVTAFQRTIMNMQKRMDQLTKGRWSMTIGAIDQASKVIKTVGGYAKKVASRTYNIAFWAVDMVTKPLKGIIDTAISLLGKIGPDAMGTQLPNLIADVKSLFNETVFMSWGKGMDKALSPALMKFREWKNENKDILDEMSSKIEQYGEKFASFMIKPIERASSYLADLFLSDNYEDLSFGAKVTLMIDDASNSFSDWWERTGHDQVTGLTGRMGTAFGDLIKGAVLGALGVDSEGASAFMKAGADAASSFIKNFIESLDIGMLATEIAKKFASINWNAITGNGSIANAIIFDLLALNAASKLLKPFDKVKELFGGKGGKGKGKCAQVKAPNQVKTSVGPSSANSPKRSIILDQYGNPIPPSMQTKSSQGTPKPKSRFKLPKLPKLPKMAGAIARKIPGLGSLLGAASLLTMSKEELPGGVGSLAGGVGGAAAGAAIGSVVPGIGTAIGGIAGGVIGSLGGGAVGDCLGSLDFKAIGIGIKEAFGGALDWISNQWSSFSNWFNETVWTPISTGASIAADWISESWNTLSNWFMENVWTPISDFGVNTINFLVGLFDMGREWIAERWQALSSWFMETVWTPISEGVGTAVDFIIERFTETYNWLSEVWGAVAEWFMETVWTPLSEGVGLAVDFIIERFTESYNSLSEVWGAVAAWFEETVWAPLQEAVGVVTEWFTEHFSSASEGIMEVWGAVNEWFTENVWGPIEQGVEAVTGVITGAFETAWGIVSDIWSGIQNMWNGVSGWVSNRWDGVTSFFSKTTKRGEDITGLNISKSSSGKKNYANGGYINRPHLGLVGEAGPEMIIPLSSSRRSRAMELYERTGRMLGVKPFANGGLIGKVPLATNDATAVGNAGAVFGDIHVNPSVSVVVQAEGNDIDANKIAEKIADAVGLNLAEKMREVAGNMPLAT